MAKHKAKSEAARKFWDKIRQVATERGISVQEARAMLTAQRQSKPNKESRVSEVLDQPKTKTKQIDLLAAEQKLRAKYPHLVPGSLQLAAPGEKKRSAEIFCQHPDCKNRRRVYTSDLFQVKFCKEHSSQRKKK